MLCVARVLCALLSCLLQGLTFHLSACRPEEYFHELALVPATLKKLTLGGFERAGNSLAPLARLTQLKKLDMQVGLTSPLPLLPALTEFIGQISGFQALFNVSATLEYALLTSYHELDFRQLACFTRLQTLELSIEDSAKNFCPEVFPPSLRCIVLECDPIIGESLVFPVGNVVIGHGNHIEWTCP